MNRGRDGSGTTLQLEATAPPQRVATTWQTPTVFRCAAMIFGLKVALRIYGFGKVIRWIGHRVKSIPATAWLDADAVKASERAVAMAGALYPGRALCLEQSLVLYYLLRRHGVAIKYRQGVMAHPFQAHAWIEYDGEVISDVAEHAKQFIRLPDQLP
jgi:hypothetical protein